MQQNPLSDIYVMVLLNMQDWTIRRHAHVSERAVAKIQLKKDSQILVTKGSPNGATLSFTLRSKGEGGQPRCLITQEVFILGPPTPARTLKANLGVFFAWTTYFLQCAENCVIPVFLLGSVQKRCKYRDFCSQGQRTS